MRLASCLWCEVEIGVTGNEGEGGGGVMERERVARMYK